MEVAKRQHQPLEDTKATESHRRPGIITSESSDSEKEDRAGRSLNTYIT